MIKLVLLLSILAMLQASQECPVAQYFQFVTKSINQSFPIIDNPYLNPSQEYLARVNQNINNKNRVCALQYLNQNKSRYQIRNFATRVEAEASGWIVTHQGVCGKCSTAKDLYVYLTTDLTRPVRKCGVRHFASHPKLWKCIQSLGFTDACTQVWYWNTLNTKKHCGLVCMVALLLKTPFVVDGKLNKCLQCDEDISGPIFKYESGRTRRNSGIKSEIDRPVDEIYNLTHCYY